MTTEQQSMEVKQQQSNSRKKAAKKKRKVSKHILQANQDHADLEKARASEPLPINDGEVEAATSGALAKTPNKTPPGAPNKHTKDVKEAAGYLSNWKNFRSQWKFNKNTQSWLIRHMYESDKVAKGSFTLLLEYLQGLQGKDAKQRILQEATRRALRYKRFEQDSKGENSKDDDEEKKETTVKFASNTKEGAEEGTSKKTVDPNSTEEEKRWNELDDHDKRKEYKRARRVLETLKSD